MPPRVLDLLRRPAGPELALTTTTTGDALLPPNSPSSASTSKSDVNLILGRPTAYSAARCPGKRPLTESAGARRTDGLRHVYRPR